MDSFLLLRRLVAAIVFKGQTVSDYWWSRRTIFLTYHYILVAWVLSLIARFDDYVSIIWLALTTAVFLQGIGAYSLRFLSPWRFGEDEFEDS